MRIGINRQWDSKWYASKKKYGKTLHQDLAIQKEINKRLKDAGISRVEILRTANAVSINIHTAKPGLIIGRGGENIEALREDLEKKFNNKFSVNILEIKKPNLDAQVVAASIAQQISRRISYRRAAKMAIQKSREAGAIGVKVRVAGRLNGVEIARSEFFSDGKIPLHTFRADIDYAYLPAWTTYGQIGVKVWIYKGDVFKGEAPMVTAELPQEEERKEAPRRKPRPRPKSGKADTKKQAKKTTKSTKKK
jgi:small subunit ribosomal protein S3